MVLVGQFLRLAPLIGTVPSSSRSRPDAIDNLPLPCPDPGEAAGLPGTRSGTYNGHSRLRGYGLLSDHYRSERIMGPVQHEGSLGRVSARLADVCPKPLQVEFYQVEDRPKIKVVTCECLVSDSGRRPSPYLGSLRLGISGRSYAADGSPSVGLTSKTELRLHTLGAVDHAAKPFPLQATHISASTGENNLLEAES